MALRKVESQMVLQKVSYPVRPLLHVLPLIHMIYQQDPADIEQPLAQFASLNEGAADMNGSKIAIITR